MRTIKSQSGATLITALIMLIVLTLLVVSGIRSSNTNLRIVGNMQMQEEAVAAAQQAIERVLSSSVFELPTPSAQTVGSYTVTFGPLTCLSFRQTVKTDPNLPDICKGSAGLASCYWTTWDITATAVDASTGAKAEIHQGVRKIAGTEATTTCL